MNDLNPKLDLTDPAVLRQQCEEMADGMAQQAMAANGRNAFQGHPNPVFFFGRASDLFRAVSKMLAAEEPKATESGKKK